MRGNQGLILAKNSCSLAGVTWTSTFMIIFCIAGCAAGSCLSYGHSCWGAHGKRSGSSGLFSIRELNDESNKNIPSPSTDDRWILSRLIAKHQIPNSEKYRVRLYDILKGKRMPHYWNNKNSVASNEEKDVIRDNAEEFMKNKESKEEFKELEIYPREVIESFADDESAEILLLPRREEKNDNVHLRFIKASTDTGDKLKYN